MRSESEQETDLKMEEEIDLEMEREMEMEQDLKMEEEIELEIKRDLEMGLERDLEMEKEMTLGLELEMESNSPTNKLEIGEWAVIQGEYCEGERGRIIGYRQERCFILRTSGGKGEEVRIDQTKPAFWCFMRRGGTFHWFEEGSLRACKPPKEPERLRFKAPHQ